MFADNRSKSGAVLLAALSVAAVETSAISGDSIGTTFKEPLVQTFPSGSVSSFTDAGTKFLWGDTTGGLETSFFQFTFDFYDTGGGFPSVGTFNYKNGDSLEGTGVPFVDLNLLLNSDGDPGESIDHRFTLQILNTGNDNPDPLSFDNADTVRFVTPTIAFGSLYLTLSFQSLDAFSEVFDGGAAMRVLETKNASAKIIASISSTPPPPPSPTGVPDAGSTFALLGSAFASMSILRRYRR